MKFRVYTHEGVFYAEFQRADGERLTIISEDWTWEYQPPPGVDNADGVFAMMQELMPPVSKVSTEANDDAR